jgi:hypothetical protein
MGEAGTRTRRRAPCRSDRARPIVTCGPSVAAQPPMVRQASRASTGDIRGPRRALRPAVGVVEALRCRQRRLKRGRSDRARREKPSRMLPATPAPARHSACRPISQRDDRSAERPQSSNPRPAQRQDPSHAGRTRNRPKPHSLVVIADVRRPAVLLPAVIWSQQVEPVTRPHTPSGSA